MIWVVVKYLAGVACCVAICAAGIMLSAKDTGPMEFNVFAGPSSNFAPID